MTTCTVPACEKETLAQGYCPAHYQRWYRFGDPLGTIETREKQKGETDTALAVRDAPPPQEVPEFQLAALTPESVQAAQSVLTEWCQAKLAAVRAEIRDLSKNYREAQKAKWRSQPWKRHIDLSQRRLDFYGKVLAALEAGYLVIPNLPLDVFAIRTARAVPLRGDTTSWGQQHQQEAQALPAGEGRYVSPRPTTSSSTNEFIDEHGKPTKKTWFFAESFQDVEFPVVGVRPQIIEATHWAAALKVFDEIGLVSTQVNVRRRDPIIVGRIRGPHRTHPGVTCFIAWWLNTRDL